MSTSPDRHPPTNAEPGTQAVLSRLSRLPEHCAPDCGHGRTQRDVTAALRALAERASVLLDDAPPEGRRVCEGHQVP